MFSLLHHVTAIDPWNFALFTAGVVLFFLSPKLAESTLFFYSSGTVLGALAFALILVFIISRWLPKVNFFLFSLNKGIKNTKYKIVYDFNIVYLQPHVKNNQFQIVSINTRYRISSFKLSCSWAYSKGSLGKKVILIEFVCFFVN